MWDPVSTGSRTGYRLIIEHAFCVVLDVTVPGTATDPQPLRTLVRACADAAGPHHEAEEERRGLGTMEVAVRTYEAIEKKVGG